MQKKNGKSRATRVGMSGTRRSGVQSTERCDRISMLENHVFALAKKLTPDSELRAPLETHFDGSDPMSKSEILLNGLLCQAELALTHGTKKGRK